MKEKLKYWATRLMPSKAAIGVILFWVAIVCFFVLLAVAPHFLLAVAMVIASGIFVYNVSRIVYEEVDDRWGS